MPDAIPAGPVPGQGRGVVTITASQRVITAAKLMDSRSLGCLAVVDEEGSLVGIVTERDILRWVSHASPQSFTAKVEDIMARDVIQVAPGTPPAQARQLMTENHIRHLVVVESGCPVGIVSIRDVVPE
jgi:CBS domain-containing protein